MSALRLPAECRRRGAHSQLGQHADSAVACDAHDCRPAGLFRFLNNIEFFATQSLFCARLASQNWGICLATDGKPVVKAPRYKAAISWNGGKIADEIVGTVQGAAGLRDRDRQN